jgi:Tol biopolymer transport system component
VTGGQPQRLPTPSFASEPATSPTRDLIACVSTKREGSQSVSSITFIDLNGNRLYASLPEPPGASGFANGTLAWSPDGRRVVVTRQATNTSADIWIVDPEAAQPYTKLIALPVGPRIHGIAWSKDGNQIIIGKHDWTSDIVLIDSGK